MKASGLDWTIVRPPAIYGPNDQEMLELFPRLKRLLDRRGGALLQHGVHAGLRANDAPMRFAASTTATTTRPGAVVSHQAVAM